MTIHAFVGVSGCSVYMQIVLLFSENFFTLNLENVEDRPLSIAKPTTLSLQNIDFSLFIFFYHNKISVL